MATAENVILSDHQIQVSNKLLATLYDFKYEYKDETVANHFPGGMLTAALSSLEKATKLIGTDPIAIYVGGTGLLKEDAGVVANDESQVAIQALKDNNRFIQLGRGRGKLLVVYSFTPLVSGAEYKNRASTRRATKVEVASLNQKVSELESDLIRLNAIMNVNA